MHFCFCYTEAKDKLAVEQISNHSKSIIHTEALSAVYSVYIQCQSSVLTYGLSQHAGYIQAEALYGH